MIETARAEVAAFAGVPPKGVIFTSGGTEALNLALTPHIETADRKIEAVRPSLGGAGEHPAVLAGHRFPPRRTLSLSGLTPSGVLDLGALDKAIGRAQASGRRVMLALQAANNETGVVQPVAAAAELVHAAGGFVVCDAVQAAGKIPCDVDALGADAIVFSAHKFGGPKGAGALCLRPGLPPYRRRARARRRPGAGACARGTENIAAIAGMAAASRAARIRLGEQAKASCSLAGRAGERKSHVACRAVVVLRRRRGAIAEYILLRRAFHRRTGIAYCFGYGGICGIVGLGVFVGKSEAVACLERDGRRAGPGGGGDPGQPWLEFAARRLRFRSFGPLKGRSRTIRTRRDKPAA